MNLTSIIFVLSPPVLSTVLGELLSKQLVSGQFTSSSPSITLDNVLFIPGATVRLISVSALTSSLKYVVHFANSDCWVTSASGAHILSGTLTAHRLYAVSGGQFTAAHALTVTRAPTLETWHNRLGHANYCMVANLARQTLATDMPLSSSPPPPSCEHCILGTQTRSSVPKVREGVRADRKLGIVHVDLLEHPDNVSASGN